MASLSIVKTFLQLCIKDDTQDLTNRQMAILLTIYDSTEEYTIKRLTDELELTKPTVSRAVDRLIELELLLKRKALKDRRSVVVEKTFKGGCFIDILKTHIDKANTKYHEMLFRSPKKELS